MKAKTLTYDKSGNKVIEKAAELTKYIDGVYLGVEFEEFGVTYQNVYFEDNGIFWLYSRERAASLAHPDAPAAVALRRNFFFDRIEAAAANGEYVRLLEIEVFKRTGRDIAPLLSARAEHMQAREDREKAEAAEAEQKRREMEEAEKHRKTTLIDSAVKAISAGGELSAEQIELIAERAGVKIHIRTIGLIRAKVTRAKIADDGRVIVWGRGLTQNNINGVCNVMREIKEKLTA